MELENLLLKHHIIKKISKQFLLLLKIFNLTNTHSFPTHLSITTH